MLVAIVLGKRLKNDGNMTDVMRKRLSATIMLNERFSPAKIILSGGIANPLAGVSEAQVMRDYLIAHGIDENKLILEGRSLTTKQNAVYSVPIAAQLGATEILLCTSEEHLERKFFNPIQLFEKELGSYDGITLRVYRE